jgi:hypothetical protein
MKRGHPQVHPMHTTTLFYHRCLLVSAVTFFANTCRIHVIGTARPLSVTFPSDKPIVSPSDNDKKSTDDAGDYAHSNLPPLSVSDDHSTSEDVEKDHQGPEPEGLIIRQGRPNIPALLEEYVSTAEGPITVHGD